MSERLLGNRYRLDRPLGQGGLSVVWRGQDLRLDRPVAVKVLSPAALGDPATLRRFDREARTVAGLTHPNIVGVYDVGVDEQTPYLVLQLIEGPSLATALASGPLSVARALDIARQTCDGLAAAHAAGVIHRDIKPGNLLLAPDGLVKVCDFGIAHLQHAPAQATLTATGTIIGTSQFMAPEQVSGSPTDARTDLYALGCVLYAMLAGSPPFTGDNPIGVAHRQLHDPPPPLGQRRPDVPPAVAALVHQLLAKNPADRPAAAEQVSARLAALARGSAVGPPAPAPPTLSPPAPAAVAPGGPSAAPATLTLPGPRTTATPRSAGSGVDRRLRTLVIAGGVTFVVLLVVLAASLFGDDGNPGRTGLPSATGTSAAASADPTPADVPTSQSPEPSPTRPPSRAPGPGELIAAIQGGLPQLVNADQLDKGGAKELNKRLGEVRRALAEGDTDKARDKLDDTFEKLADLREEDKLTSAGYEALNAALTQLAQSLQQA